MTEQLVAPIPYFGGKRKSVHIVWPRLGTTVNSYFEPFGGSLAMLLGRPGGAGKYETVNDIDGMVSNFFRAVRGDPLSVAAYADYPINETDVHARHRWLVDRIVGLTEKLEADPDYFDAKIAGWWCWGKSAWIGDGWCRHPEWRQRPDITGAVGVHQLAKLKRQVPRLAGDAGIHRKVPELHGNKGIHAESSSGIVERMLELAARLRHVRVCCGDWKRIVTPSSMGTNATGHDQGISPAGVYLDPAYKGFAKLYAKATDTHDEVVAFCKQHENDPRVRIALSGYEGEYDLPGWDVVSWKAHGGYANQSSEPNENAHKERIWFSPHCLKLPEQRGMFGEGGVFG